MRQPRVLLTLLLAVSGLTLTAAEALPDHAVSLLQQRCVACHNPKTALSGLRLDDREHLLKGGTRGAAVVPGKSGSSLLIHAVERSGKLVMPPGPPLTPAEIDTLKRWVNAGAEWPAQASAARPAPSWWSFQPPVRPPVPPVQGTWARTPVDAFILARLQQKGLSPAPEADRRALARRAYFDLHGLPPTAEQMNEFVRDQRPDAWEQLVDRLLASPRYGERWGKHWLDLVRYGDTSGFEQDPYLLYAWRYRDYVIKSLNDDKPYDRFLQEQLAGDELFPEDPHAQQGTAYFTVGTNRDMLFKVEDVNRDEQLTDFVDTTSSVFMGLTVGCARCHDHKYDPIPQKDYYRLRAVFAPLVKTRVFLDYNAARSYDLGDNVRTFKAWEVGAQIRAIEEPYRDRFRKDRLAKLPADVQEAFAADEAQRTPRQKALFEQHQKSVRVTDDEVRAALSPADLERLQAIEKRLLSMYRGSGPGPLAPGAMDVGREAERTFLPARNGQPPELVHAGFLTALGGHDVPEPAESAVSTGRRRALAQWLTKPDHPLTARVMVNRIWQGHFGRGLVASPSDFGMRGAAPTHPELLDWLATEFVGQGWSLKKLHRTLMLSSVYRQAVTPNADAKQKDPENLHLSHFSRRRLEAEEIRDAVLQSAGTLNLKMGGRPVVPPLMAEELYGMSQPADNMWVVNGDAREHNRRSVYLISRRTFRMPLMEVFDRPDGVMSCPSRDSSTTAPQSLTLLNGSFTMEQARRLAAAIAAETDGIGAAWRRVLGRDPDTQERSTAETFLARQKQHLGEGPQAWTELARALLNTNEFLYVD